MRRVQSFFPLQNHTSCDYGNSLFHPLYSIPTILSYHWCSVDTLKCTMRSCLPHMVIRTTIRNVQSYNLDQLQSSELLAALEVLCSWLLSRLYTAPVWASEKGPVVQREATPKTPASFLPGFQEWLASYFPPVFHWSDALLVIAHTTS